jgi:hypothetical protein
MPAKDIHYARNKAKNEGSGALKSFPFDVLGKVHSGMSTNVQTIAR